MLLPKSEVNWLRCPISAAWYCSVACSLYYTFLGGCVGLEGGTFQLLDPGFVGINAQRTHFHKPILCKQS